MMQFRILGQFSNLKRWRLQVRLPVVLAVRHENTVHLMFHVPRCSHEAPAAHRQSFLLFLLSTSVEVHVSAMFVYEEQIT